MIPHLWNALRWRSVWVAERALAAVPHPMLERRCELLEALSLHLQRATDFDVHGYLEGVQGYADSMRRGPFEYAFSAASSRPTLYASVYACLLAAQTGRLAAMGADERRAWASFLDGFQTPADGLFRDPAVAGPALESRDWWGARHLMLHVLPAYVALGARPAHPLRYLDAYKDEAALQRWFSQTDWQSRFTDANDVDNKLMNVACALQFSRDFLGDASAGPAVRTIQRLLLERVDPKTGLWGPVVDTDPAALSRSVQFAYHLYPILLYDGIRVPAADKAVALALRTQNSLGGFGVAQNSSACEDIDSIEIMVRLAPSDAKLLRPALIRALAWVLVNQNADGGFVFRRHTALEYGHRHMAARAQQSEMFSTWFRTLSVMLLHRGLHGTDAMVPRRVPGYYV